MKFAKRELKSHQKKATLWSDMLINLIEGILSQCICISNPHAYFKYLTSLFFNYTTISLKKYNWGALLNFPLGLYGSVKKLVRKSVLINILLYAKLALRNWQGWHTT